MGVTTGAAARILGVSTKTILHWSADGFLNPIRTVSGWRLYDPKELEKVARARMKKFSVAA